MKKPNGYWKIRENFEAEVREAIQRNNGEFPTQPVLNQMNLSTLGGYISRYGGINAVMEKMGYEPRRKINGYYENWENLKKELEDLIKEIGHFPSHDEFKKAGKSSLSTAICKLHGGYYTVREKMGYESKRTRDFYYKNWKIFKKDMKKAIKQNNGEFPSRVRLRKMGFSGLITGIDRFHGGIVQVRQKMDYELKTKPPGYWKKWENLEAELKEAIKKNNGKFPTQKRLIEMDHRSLVYGAVKYHGGFLKVKEKMGYESKRKLPDYLKDWKIFKRELKGVIKKDGRFPRFCDLEKSNKFNLVYAIIYHGGIYAVREKMGLEFEIKPKNYWIDRDNFEKEMKKAIDKNNGEFPTYSQLYKLGFGGLALAISRYQGGIRTIREKMGYEQIRIPSCYYKKWSTVERELREIIKNNKNIPTAKKLRESGKAALAESIKKYHGGMNAVRIKLGLNYIVKPNGYWNKKKVIYELKKFIKKNNGKFPTQKELKKEGNGLYRAVSRYCEGLTSAREIMGYKLETRPRKYWKNWDNVEREMNEAIKENGGEFPKQSDLVRMNKISLVTVATDYGGLYAIREKIGYNEQMRRELARDLEEIAERLVG